jgi:hypothetical protein
VGSPDEEIANMAEPVQPSREETWQAIEIWLRVAYDGPPPAAVQSRIDALRAAGDALYASPAFERGSDGHGALRLRLGNRHYPHMKLCIEQRPDGAGALFCTDTHDGHACPAADSPDYARFSELMAANHDVADAIEAAWSEAGLLTFKNFLRDDLARRGGHAHGPPEGK